MRTSRSTWNGRRRTKNVLSMEKAIKGCEDKALKKPREKPSAKITMEGNEKSERLKECDYSEKLRAIGSYHAYEKPRTALTVGIKCAQGSGHG